MYFSIRSHTIILHDHMPGQVQVWGCGSWALGLLIQFGKFDGCPKHSNSKWQNLTGFGNAGLGKEAGEGGKEREGLKFRVWVSGSGSTGRDTGQHGHEIQEQVYSPLKKYMIY